MSLIARQEVEPYGSTSLQERIAIHSIKVVLKFFLMSAEDPLRGFSSQPKNFNLHLDSTTGFIKIAL
jgi:adenylosuccinate lyase